MEHLDGCYPGFKLAIHKGYGTAAHLAALRQQDPSPLHRRSFNPVRVALAALDPLDDLADASAFVPLDPA